MQSLLAEPSVVVTESCAAMRPVQAYVLAKQAVPLDVEADLQVGWSAAVAGPWLPFGQRNASVHRRVRHLVGHMLIHYMPLAGVLTRPPSMTVCIILLTAPFWCCTMARAQDMYDVLRPGLVRFVSYPEACAAVSDILAKEAAASASGLEPIDEDDDDDSEEDVRR